MIAWLAAASCAADAGNFPLFVDVTSTHLPSADLRGLSMDARFADVDQDGDPDLIIANEFRPNILLLNDGSGRFSNVSATHLPQTRRDSEDVGIADFDRDGDLDIVIVSEDDRVNELYLNDGQGRFTDASERLPVTGVSNAVLVEDIDLDGDADILIGNNGQNVVLINDGTGFFSDETAQRLPLLSDVTQDIELGDVDGDGNRDLLVGNEGANRLLLNTGGGVFRDVPTEHLPLITGPEETREADLGDVDGDGDLDILFANVRLFVAGAWRQNRLLINNGQGHFSDETAQRLPADDDQSMDGDFVDIDADGDLDIITANLDSVAGRPANARYRVYANDGQGVFVEATDRFFSPEVTGNGLDIEAVDVNGDAQLDLYLASRGGTDRLLLYRLHDE
ncbi:MAG: hypothetical protein ETSY1_14070 [Candidatus Entotheonella factor]|uniref:VCBS repeat-containing protein n=1 Tax=Entotheonella factor TaxID=1429438 RepID=W4LQJ9_ENTF1|nr:VCBS repeat-containing protein [Candidatus Entotheonella palauensis]ETW99686.1 MAG: hypothetical protein ETSY1_14070 [Candidatus Entotheonella factor]